MFDRFTDEAKQAMSSARLRALELGHDYIGTEHILLSLVGEGTGTAVKVLGSLGIDPARIEREVGQRIVTLPAMVTSEQLPFTSRGRKVLVLAMEEASQLGNDYIGTEHLLLGLIREGEGIAAQVLRNLGLAVAATREQIVRLLGSEGREESRPQRPVRRLGIVGRWLSHWSFWPAYAAVVVLLIALLRPWEKWSSAGRARAEDAPDGIQVHEKFQGGTDWFVGSVLLVWGSVGPPGPGWILCDGRRLARAEYPELFKCVGERFGADPAGFQLPDYRGLNSWRASRGIRSTMWIPADDAAGKATGNDQPLQFWIKAR